MHRRPNDSSELSPPRRSRLQFECIFASVWLAAGLFIAPAAIYWVGILLLGPYGEGAGLGAFYADFFGDLASFAAPAWAIALAPLVMVSLVRLLFFNWRLRPSGAEDAEEETPARPNERSRRPREVETPARRQAPRTRVEPRIGQDSQ